MKNTLTIKALTIAAAGAAALFGQLPFGSAKVTNVPFPFYQGKQLLAAGPYELRQTNSNTAMLTNRATGIASAWGFVPDKERLTSKGELRFHCYEAGGGAGQKCFLRAASAPATGMAFRFAQSSAEKEIERAGVKARPVAVETARAGGGE